ITRISLFLLFTHPAPPEIYTLSLHDALPISVWSPAGNQIAFIQTRSGKTEQWLIQSDGNGLRQLVAKAVWACWPGDGRWLYYSRSEEHTSELQSLAYLVCRLLLEKKNK